jgi:hypothetical protein
MPGDDSYFGMFTGGCHQFWVIRSDALSARL